MDFSSTNRSKVAWKPLSVICLEATPWQEFASGLIRCQGSLTLLDIGNGTGLVYAAFTCLPLPIFRSNASITASAVAVGFTCSSLSQKWLAYLLTD